MRLCAILLHDVWCYHDRNNVCTLSANDKPVGCSTKISSNRLDLMLPFNTMFTANTRVKRLLILRKVRWWSPALYLCLKSTAGIPTRSQRSNGNNLTRYPSSSAKASANKRDVSGDTEWLVCCLVSSWSVSYSQFLHAWALNSLFHSVIAWTIIEWWKIVPNRLGLTQNLTRHTHHSQMRVTTLALTRRLCGQYGWSDSVYR